NDQLEDFINYLKNADSENLDDSLKNLASLVKRGDRDTSHFCCKVPTRNETLETRTRIVSFNTVATSQHIIGYEPCGNLTGSTISTPTTKPGQLFNGSFPICVNKPIYETVTHLAIQYKLETYAVSVVSVNCPPEHVICCDGYTMFNGQCIPTGLLGNLQDLINLGIIG
ncbi:unnamed protein product, partial [Brachionus calyciflorus]